MVKGEARLRSSGDLQGQVESAAASPPLQDSRGGMVLIKDVTAHALSKNLNSVFRQLKHGVWNLLVIWGFSL